MPVYLLIIGSKAVELTTESLTDKLNLSVSANNVFLNFRKESRAELYLNK